MRWWRRSLIGVAVNCCCWSLFLLLRPPVSLAVTTARDAAHARGEFDMDSGRTHLIAARSVGTGGVHARETPMMEAYWMLSAPGVLAGGALDGILTDFMFKVDAWKWWLGSTRRASWVLAAELFVATTLWWMGVTATLLGIAGWWSRRTRVANAG